MRVTSGVNLGSIRRQRAPPRWVVALPFFSAKATASSLEEKERTMLDRGSALKEGRGVRLKPSTIGLLRAAGGALR